MQRKLGPRNIGKELSEPKKNTAAPRKKQNSYDKQTLFLAATMIESAYQTTVRCAPVDEVRFVDTYNTLKKLYEVVDK